MDVSGEVVLEKILNNAAAGLSTGDLPAGSYFLKIRTAQSECVWKLAKI
jgi:hypothetical protein